MNNRIDSRLMIASAACAVAVILFGSTLVRAMTADAVVTPPVAPKPQIDPASSAAAETITMQAVNEAVAIDPFSPERTPPETPYRLPTDPEDPPPPAAPPAPPPLPGFKLVGTAQTSTGGIALIQIDNATPKVVALGESLNGFTVQRIDRVSATMVQGDRRVDLQLQQPSMRGDANARRGQPAGGRAPVNVNGRVQMDNAVRAQQQMIEQMEALARRVQQDRTVTVEIPDRPRRDTTSLRSPRSDR